MFRSILLLCLFIISSSPTRAQEKIPLWPQGAPGFEDRKGEPEQARDWWVKNIHNPSITAYLPDPTLATGTAVVICPGGGHRELVFDAEGTDAALFFNKLGVAAFILKYRLGREEGSPYDVAVHPKQDILRAMRVVRSRSEEWNLDPSRLGAMGFSAGGEVVNMIAYDDNQGNPADDDPIERSSANPDFQVLIYPGPLGIPEAVSKDAPPAFLLAAIDDPCCSGPTLRLLNAYHKAGASAEGHVFAQGSHAFNMGLRSDLKSIHSWPERLADWMEDTGLLKNSRE